MSRRIYRALLAWCPLALREEYGAAMEEMAARRLADARAAGVHQFLYVLLRELAGLLVIAVLEPWSAAERIRRRRRRLESQWKAGRMDRIGQETWQAARRLLKSPAFTLAAVATLALAIAANAAIFAVVQRVVLNPLPYPDSDRLITLDHGAQKFNVPSGFGITLGLFHHYTARARTLDGVAIYRTGNATLTGVGEPEQIVTARAVPSLASVLRVSPALGRWFSADEGQPGAPLVAVLSHGLWMRRYGGDPRVLGRSIALGGVPVELIGVMPQLFAFPQPNVDLWMAERVSPSMGFGLWTYAGVARLRDGASIEDARAELSGLIADLPAAFPGDALARGNGPGIGLVPAARTLKEATIGNVGRSLWILLASVGLVLLVACANVANLFLVRSEARQRDVAVRRALGAGRSGIARYFLTESLLLSLAGGAAGLALAWGAVGLLVRLGPATLPRLHEVRLDAVVVAFTLGLSLLSALAFGALPLWRGAPLAASLHDGGRGNTASRGRHHARRLLMGAQVALALVLLVGSGLMVRSFQRLRAVDPGFDAASALSFSISLPDRGYTSREAAVAAHHAMLERLSAIPGVTAVSASTCLPLAGSCFGNSLRIDGLPIPEDSAPPVAFFRAVASGYFETMGIRLLRGRTLTQDDIDRREPVVVINQALARRFFRDEDPIGRRIRSNAPPPKPGQAPTPWMTIVGVVGNTPWNVLAETAPFAQLYMPMSIAGGPGIPGNALIGPDISLMSYVVRSTTPPTGLVPAVRRAVDGVDTSLAVAQVRTLQEILDRAAAQMAFTMTLLAIAATVALLLGVIGIYGVMSYIVSQRTGEIGVRLALGAEPAAVAAMIARQGARVILAGIGVGVAAAVAGSRLIEALLYGVSSRDPGVFAATTLILVVVALAACWLPARRAARLSPVEALRTD